MRNLLLVFIIAIFCTNINAQTPESFNYQSIMRSANGDVLVNKNVTMRFSIGSDEQFDSFEYQETQQVITSNQGLVSIAIGEGEPIMGDFMSVNWNEGNNFIQVELKLDESSDFMVLGISQLRSVPYALHAKTVDNTDDADADPENELQDISIDGTELSITSGSTIDLLAIQDGTEDADADPENELQDISIEGTELSITNGSTINLSAIQDGTEDADADPENEIQDLELNDNILTITNKTNPTEINLTAYTGTNTDEQAIDLTDNVLSISGNSSTADLTGYLDNTDEQELDIVDDYLVISGGNGIDITDFHDGYEPNTDEQLLKFSDNYIFITNGNAVDLTSLYEDEDADPSNEIQTLSYSDDSLALSNGNKIPLRTDTSLWMLNNNNIFFNTGKVGIGSTSPQGKFEVKGGALDNDVLFGVINSYGDTVFAVYQSGVRINVDDSPSSKATGNRGGFAVGGFSSGKSGISQDFLSVSQDSVRIYVSDDNPLTKGNRGGFAVGGFSSGKGIYTDEYFRVLRDSVRIYVDPAPSKATGNRGGFAVGGFSSGKGAPTINYMHMTPENSLIGQNAGSKITTGYDNIFLGNNSGFSNTAANSNIFIGNSAGYHIQDVDATDNIFIGNKAGYLLDNFDTYCNIFVGNESGYNSQAGGNLFMGWRSGYDNVSGEGNMYIGNNAGENLDFGQYNVFLGHYAGYGPATGDPSGRENVLVGCNTGFHDTDEYNVIIGTYAAFSPEAANKKCVYVGNNAGEGNGGSNNVFIGYQAGSISSPEPTMDNRLLISSGSTIIEGDFSTGGLNLGICSSALLSGTIQVEGDLLPDDDTEGSIGTSTKRWNTAYFSDDINTGAKSIRNTKNSKLTYGINEIMKMNPVMFNYSIKNKMVNRLSLDGENLLNIIPEVVSKQKDGYSIKYSSLIPVLISGMQEMQTEINDLKKENKELRDYILRINRLEEQLKKLSN